MLATTSAIFCRHHTEKELGKACDYLARGFSTLQHLCFDPYPAAIDGHVERH